MRLQKQRGAAAVLSISMVVGWSSFAGASDRGVLPPSSRPPDIPTERLERPRPEQDRSTLRQSEAVALARAAARKELGRSFDEYELKAAVFSSAENAWSVTFSLKPPRPPSEGCLVVIVRGDTKATDVLLCS